MSTTTQLHTGRLAASPALATRGHIAWVLCLTAAAVAALGLASITRGLAAPGEQPARQARPATVKATPAAPGDTSVPDAAAALRLAPDAPTEAAPTF